ncbi:MAG: hypothetical protein PW735_06670 [Acidobacteriaceae bacterium]|nr:hypothetical protein [Acidobacteriaceae bacterium]
MTKIAAMFAAKGSIVRMLGLTALAAGVFALFAPQAEAQRFAVGVVFGGPRYYAPPPPPPAYWGYRHHCHPHYFAPPPPPRYYGYR